VGAARFAVRPARLADAAAITAVQVASWRSAYRTMLPAPTLAAMSPRDPGRIARRRELLGGSGLNLVAVDTTHGDVVGYAQAGPSRRAGPAVGELYELYLLDRARRFGLGTELFAGFAAWNKARDATGGASVPMSGRRGLPSAAVGGSRAMIVWVLEPNHAARRFYEALGGIRDGRVHSHVGGFPVVEVSYVWR
jgi:GNAT superfamily N-acetyltransferase